MKILHGPRASGKTTKIVEEAAALLNAGRKVYVIAMNQVEADRLGQAIAAAAPTRAEKLIVTAANRVPNLKPWQLPTDAHDVLVDELNIVLDVILGAPVHTATMGPVELYRPNFKWEKV